MSKATKQLLVGELTKRLKGTTAVVACSTKGLKAQEIVHLRAALRLKNVRALMVKNAMCARAFDELGLGFAKPLLEGPTTLVYGGDSLAEVAKLLVAQVKTFKALEVRGGAMDGAVLTPADVAALSKLPSREELIGGVVGALLSPVSGVLSALMSPAQQLASQIEKISERTEPQAA
jgi:large subunit ribosomal protein L10